MIDSILDSAIVLVPTVFIAFMTFDLAVRLWHKWQTMPAQPVATATATPEATQPEAMPTIAPEPQAALEPTPEATAAPVQLLDAIVPFKRRQRSAPDLTTWTRRQLLPEASRLKIAGYSKLKTDELRIAVGQAQWRELGAASTAAHNHQQDLERRDFSRLATVER